jgi:urease accessory protein
MTQRRLFKHGFVLLALVALVMAPAAQAHVAEGGAGSVLAGLLHPVTGLDHVVAMVAVGLWGAVLGMPAVGLLPVGLPLPGVETGIALSALVLGVMVMLQQRLPLLVAAGLVGLFALFHGYAHGLELPDGADALLFSFAFVVATGLLHLVGIALGELARFPWGRGVQRACGGLIAVVGVWSLIQLGGS